MKSDSTCINQKLLDHCFYGQNTHITNSKINVYYEDLVSMTPEEFEFWVIEMRKEILRIWDDYGIPPRSGGKSEDEIIGRFNKMLEYPVWKFTHTDELSDVEDDVIINVSGLGSEADQWFENMYKTRINRTSKDDGYSIYDLLKNDKHLPSVIRRSFRHFRRDSFYIHAQSIKRNDKKTGIIASKSGKDWVESFFNNQEIFNNRDFILEEVNPPEGVNAGYFQLDETNLLHLSADKVKEYKDNGLLQYRHHSTFDIENMSNKKMYRIRIYEKGKKIFPRGFIPFRIGYIQPAVNFPPMTAKYLYERFTEDIKDQEVINIYDPSAGWGGRILGAMAVRDDRRIHYIGTDPNPDNFYNNGNWNKYESLAYFYNTKTYRGNPVFSETNTYDIFQECSEEIQHNSDFHKYRGKLDFIFTSPPYFNREAYSEDESQSYKKFGSSYESWKEGFLRPTLETCVEYLKPDRYLLWNIADIKINKKTTYPLEGDSKDILKSLGMKFVMVIKMAMIGMPGQNRLDENGIPVCKNFCKVNGQYYKYEPIFVWKKPV